MMEAILEASLMVLGAIGFVTLFTYLLVSILLLVDDGYEDSPKWSLQKLIGWVFIETYRNISTLFKPTSPLQREIMQEEKEIKNLERQKADMERLDQLRERKKRLWEETEKDYRKSAGPHFKHCPLCDNAFSGNHCDCLDDKKVRAYTPEQTAKILDNRVTMEEAIKNHNKAMKNLRK